MFVTGDFSSDMGKIQAAKTGQVSHGSILLLKRWYLLRVCNPTYKYALSKHFSICLLRISGKQGVLLVAQPLPVPTAEASTPSLQSSLCAGQALQVPRDLQACPLNILVEIEYKWSFRAFGWIVSQGRQKEVQWEEDARDAVLAPCSLHRGSTTRQALGSTPVGLVGHFSHEVGLGYCAWNGLSSTCCAQTPHREAPSEKALIGKREKTLNRLK